jgi:DNA invertase Pin-like site-specific DNA recombinase
LAVRWSICSAQSRALRPCGVDLHLDQQAIDTTTPAGKLMFQITDAFAEFELDD